MEHAIAQVAFKSWLGLADLPLLSFVCFISGTILFKQLRSDRGSLTPDVFDFVLVLPKF